MKITIPLDKEVNTMATAMGWMYENSPECCLTISTYWWLFPTYIVPALSNHKNKSHILTYKNSGKEFDKIEKYKKLTLDKYNIERLMNQTECLEADRMIDPDHNWINTDKDAVFKFIDTLRTTAPLWKDIIANYPYSKLIDILPEMPPKFNTWYIIDNNYMVKSKMDLIHYLNFFRLRARSNFNLLYRVFNNVRIWIGNSPMPIHHVSLIGPHGILNKMKVDEYQIGMTKIRRAVKSEIPKAILSGNEKHLNNFTAIEGPGLYSLYAGRTAILSGDRKGADPVKIQSYLKDNAGKISRIVEVKVM